MRYAIFSDIHSNLEAFQVINKFIETENIDKRIFLGDIVGYGANPNECIELLRKSADIVLGGNHDYAAVEKTDISCFNEYAKAAILWTRKVLSQENKNYLAALPVIDTFKEITIAHSSPWEPSVWHYIVNIRDARNNFEYFDTQLCFIGHSHHPVTISRLSDGTLKGTRDQLVSLNEESRYIINDGSVGQPRDGNPDASFCIYDSDAKTVENKRIPYNIDGQQDSMRDAGLPDFLIDRIGVGR